MTTNELKIATLKQLREAREGMLSMEYLIALEKLSPEERNSAAVNLSNVQLAYLKLRATRIAEIREKLEENNDDLVFGIGSVEEKLKNLSNIKEIIGAVSNLVSIVARIITML